MRGGASGLALPAVVPLSARVRRVWDKDPREVVLTIGDDAMGPMVRTRRGLESVDATALARARRGWAGLVSAVIEVPVGKCLRREITLPDAAMRRADDVLALDLARTTPFKPDDVLSAWYRPRQSAGPGGSTVHQVVLKRSLVAEAMAQLELAGIPLKEIRAVSADGERLPINLLPAGSRRTALIGRLAAWGVVGLLVAVVVLEGARLGFEAYGLDKALAQLDQAQQAATLEVQALRRKVAEAQAGAAQIRQPRLRKLASQPVIGIWEELTRVLPTATTLTELKIEGALVQLDGTSANASELIGLLAASTLFSKVTFASPVTRDNQRGLERFQIRLQAGRPGEAVEQATRTEAGK